MTVKHTQSLEISEAFQADTTSLYIHIPFCETKCPYCDFNTYAGIEPLMSEYVDALIQEARYWGDALSRHHPPAVGTVFFGGGTPSYLPPGDIARILDEVRSAFHLTPAAEITLESNPGDIAPGRVEAWLKAGINRLSIGVQSLDDGLLQLLGRRHTAQEALAAHKAARNGGFASINLDLMYGLPYQTLDQWRDTLEKALEDRPEHISMYSLTLEEGTPLEASVRHGKVPYPDPDLGADMYQLAMKLGQDAGYNHYEISNWALPGRECLHNLTYWRNQPYLGIGPGAHSYLNGYRFSNLRSPKRYIQLAGALTSAKVHPAALHEYGLLDMVEAIDERLEMAETMMLGLRLSEGVSQGAFLSRFGVSLVETYGPQIDELLDLKLVAWQEDHLVLTANGRLLGNEVFQRFLFP